jgi:hypothetical protein
VRDRDAIYGQDFAAMTRDMEMRKCLLRRDSPGKIRLWNDSWAPSDASAWTTLSFGMRDRCVELFAAILPFTSGHVRIWPWAKTPRSPGPWNRWNRGAWLQFLSSGDCTTDTSDAPLSRSERLRRPLPSLSGNAACLGSTDQTFADPKPDSFATRTPCTWMHSTTGRGRDCQSLDSEVPATTKPVCIDEICD